MTKNRAKGLLSLVLLTGSTLANASMYLGGGYGYGYYDDGNTGSTVAVTDSHQAGTLFAGFLKHHHLLDLGIELNAEQLPKKKWSIIGDDFTLRSKTLGLAGILRINQKSLFLQLKAGVDYVYQKTESIVTDSATSLPLSDIGQNNHTYRPVAGIGVGVMPFDSFQVDVLYTHLFASQSSAPISTNNTVATSANFNKISSLDTLLLRVSYTWETRK